MEQTDKHPNASDLTQFLDRGLAGEDLGWSRSGRMIASYLRDNWRNLAFETGASIAAALQISEMTVIRFIRQLGYGNLKEFKEALKTADATDLSHVAQTVPTQSLGDGALEKRLQRELQAISEVYRLTALPRWGICANQLAHHEFVSVISFQQTKGVAIDFATALQYVRPQVRYIDDHSSVCPEILDMKGRSHCLVLIDITPLSRKSKRLAQRAKEIGMPLIIVTDTLSNWAYDYTEMVLQGPIGRGEAQGSGAVLSVLMDLLAGSIAGVIGPAAKERRAHMVSLEDHFDECRPTPAPRGTQHGFDFTA